MKKLKISFGIPKTTIAIVLLTLILTTIPVAQATTESTEELGAIHQLLKSPKYSHHTGEEKVDLIINLLEKREFDYVVLNNKLKVLLVSDPNTPIASVALDLN